MHQASTHLANAKCLGCGYALRELTTNTCPECGRDFDPGDPSTMRLPRNERRASWFVRTPIGWPMALAAAAPATLLLWETSSPGPEIGLVLMLLLLSGAVFTWWLIRALAQACACQWQWRRWLIVPAIFLATALVASFDLPLRVRFSLSLPSLRQEIETPLTSSRIVGLYDIKWVDVRGNATLFYTGSSFLDDVGFIYLPEEAVNPGVGVGASLGGGWYVFYEPW